MSSELRIAVSGKSGCGNTTVSRLLAERLNIRLINYTFHDMAAERGMTFDELCRQAEQDPQYDLYLDKKQVELASRGSCVLGSRLAIWLLKQADLKIYLAASAEVRARRIAEREQLPFRESWQSMVERDERDQQRYLRLYGLDTDSYDFADMIIDTEHYDQVGVVELILGRLEKLGKPRSRRKR
jgi:cytidylate kinase